MKKILLLFFATMMCGAMMGQKSPTMPKHMVVAGQNGANVQVYDCITKTTKSVPGYLRNIGIDLSGNVYILVSEDRSGWGNYYVYKNYDTRNPYQSLVWNATDGIYSSMAMKVKDNDVVVAGVQSLGFNNKGYSSRMFGYVNKKLKFMNDYERKSLKYEEFKGYTKITGSGLDTKVIGYGQENNSGNPQGDHLSCVYRVECVDYFDGKIYTGGWGEREYSETPVGYRKQYLVRRCPRVWKNGAEYVVPHENKTGAVWNLFKFSERNTRTFYSGHLGSVGYLWDGRTDRKIFNTSTYPGIVSEAGVYDTTKIYYNKEWGTYLYYVRTYLVKQTNGRYIMYESYYYNPTTGTSVERWFKNPIEILTTTKGAVTSTKKGYYAVYARVDNTLEIFAKQDLEYKFYIDPDKNGNRIPSTLQFQSSGILCSLPKSFNPDNLKIAAVDDK